MTIGTDKARHGIFKTIAKALGGVRPLREGPPARAWRAAPRQSELENIVRGPHKPSAPQGITQAMVTAETVSEDYHHFPGSLHTVCALTLKNGFTVTGESACLDPANFDADLGRTLAKVKARQKVFEHLAFRARDELSREMRARQIVEEISTDFEQSALRRAQASLL